MHLVQAPNVHACWLVPNGSVKSMTNQRQSDRLPLHEAVPPACGPAQQVLSEPTVMKVRNGRCHFVQVSVRLPSTAAGSGFQVLRLLRSCTMHSLALRNAGAASIAHLLSTLASVYQSATRWKVSPSCSLLRMPSDWSGGSVTACCRMSSKTSSGMSLSVGMATCRPQLGRGSSELICSKLRRLLAFDAVLLRCHHGRLFCG
jgi:hypothetical protein